MATNVSGQVKFEYGDLKSKVKVTVTENLRNTKKKKKKKKKPAPKIQKCIFWN